MRKFTLPLKVLVIASIGFFIYQALFAPVETGQNMKSVDWLPADATNVTFHLESQFGWTREYTCQINEKSFRKFASEEDWALKPIANEKVFLKKIMSEEIIINKGLVYIHKQNNGGGKYIHYDLDTETLYYFAAHR